MSQKNKSLHIMIENIECVLYGASILLGLVVLHLLIESIAPLPLYIAGVSIVSFLLFQLFRK